jgi:hypothetical protein
VNRIRNILWPRVVAEGAAIVASILLAFWIQAWWDDRAQRDAELDYLTGLQDEFAETQVLLNDHIQYVGRRFRSVDRVLEAIGGTGAEGAAADEFSVMIGSAYGVTPVTLPTDTYQDLVNSGNLRLIKNRSLRSEMARLVALLDEVEEHARLISETFWINHAPFIDKHAVISDFGWFFGDQSRTGIEIANMIGQVPPAPFDIDVERLRSREFWNLMYEWKTLYADQLVPLMNARDRCQDVLDMLEEELEATAR